MASQESLKQTALYELHRELGAKMVPFAGFDMPVQFTAGVLDEHLHTRAKAGLFDVSHMGQIRLSCHDVASALERIVPGDIQGLAPGRMRYTQFINERGCIFDDLMVTNFGDHLYLVVNAACKEEDLLLLEFGLEDRVQVESLDDRALLALQGPAAESVLARLAPACADLAFMSAAELELDGSKCLVSRSGYTGEDGFEISVPADNAEKLARRLLAEAEVAPVGLGARDTLRLEAGLCLYGHDIDLTTTPVEAGLLWSIGKRRREQWNFPGAKIIRRQIAEGPSRKRVGIRPDGRAPARENTEIMDADGAVIGKITSGGFGPTVGGPIAMGYVTASHAEPGQALNLLVRGKALPAKVAKLPFVAPGYKRG